MSLFPTAVTSPSIPSFPPRNPSENDFSDAYVKFIFACNPQIPIPLSRSMATSARLHGLLESTPRFKSDLPLYPYSLYTIAKEEDSLHIGQDWDWVGLVSRLDIVTSATRKDQHAIDTFAEKVKHWATRSRFDAFLSYLLDKPHEYYTSIPPHADTTGEPVPFKLDAERAGLPPSHDPVFQALLPQVPTNSSRTSNNKPRRALPSRDPTVASFDDDYFQFILYCNPDIPVPNSFENPLITNLRCIIHNTPAHENKTFAPYMLFSAVSMRYRRNNADRVLESKDWDWEKLAMDLDVLPVDADPVTVKRWSQRVKAWAEATRMDAFLHAICSEGPPHPYYAVLPRPDAPLPKAGEKRAGLYSRQDQVYKELHRNNLKRYVATGGGETEEESGRENKRSRRTSSFRTSSPSAYSIPPQSDYSPHPTATKTPKPGPPPSTRTRKPSNMTTRSQISDLSVSQASPQTTPLTRPTNQYGKQPANARYATDEAPAYQLHAESPSTVASDVAFNTVAAARVNSASSARKSSNTAKPPTSRKEPVPALYTFQHHQVPQPSLPATSVIGAPSSMPNSAAIPVPVPVTVPVATPSPRYPGSAPSNAAPPTAAPHAPNRLSQSSQTPTRYAGPVTVPNDSTYNSLAMAEPLNQPANGLPYNATMAQPPPGLPNTPHGSIEIQTVIRAFTNHLQHAKLQSRNKPLSLPEASSLATATIDKIRALCLPSLPETFMAIYIAGVLGLGPSLGLGGQVSRSLTVTARENVAQKRLMDWFVPLIPPPAFNAEQHSRPPPPPPPPPPSSAPHTPSSAQNPQHPQPPHPHPQPYPRPYMADPRAAAAEAYGNPYAYGYAPAVTTPLVGVQFDIQYDINPAPGLCVRSTMRTQVDGVHQDADTNGGNGTANTNGNTAGAAVVIDDDDDDDVVVKADDAHDSPKSVARTAGSAPEPPPPHPPAAAASASSVQGVESARSTRGYQQAAGGSDSDGFSSSEDENDDGVDKISDDDEVPSYATAAGTSKGETEADWRAKYMRLRKQMRKKESALNGYRRKIMDAVMADLE